MTALALALVVGCGDSDSGDARSGDTQPAASTPRSEATQPPASGTSAATAADAGATLADVPELFRQLSPSVVAVLVRGGGEGSGVVIQPRRVVTNHHVVDGASSVTLALASGERIPAQVLASAPRDDLAVLGVQRDLPPAEFADALPPVGSLALAMGNPVGFENSVTAGIVSALDRAVPSGGTTPALINLLQTDAAISPGNSGGALVGGDGRVIGVNVAYLPPQGGAVAIGFAIPAPTVTAVVEQLLGDGQVRYAYLGAQLEPLTPEIAQQLGVEVEEGVVIAAVGAGTPAADAELRPGDVLVRAGEQPVRAVEDLYALLRKQAPGDRLELEVVRDGRRSTVAPRLAERPREPAR